MSELNLKTQSRTNWAKVDSLEDDEIDTSDISPLDEDFFKRAKLRQPHHRVSVTIDVDEEVWEWFKAQGDDYQTRLNAALRIYAEAHQR